VNAFPPDGLPELILDHCTDIFRGDCTVRADLSMALGEALVLMISDPAGRRWIAKAIRRPKAYRRELDAYLQWVPALGVHAPQLHAHLDDLQVILVNRLPDHPADEATSEPDVYAQAGAVIRRLHDSAPPVVDSFFADRLAERLENYIRRGAGLLSTSDVGFARAQVSELRHLPAPATVPCHLDNQPRNWLVDSAGSVRLIDFGQAKRDVWIQDVSRMYFRDWQRRPDLQEAFFSRYGRWPDDADRHLLHACAAYSAVSTVVWAREHADPAFEQQGRDLLTQLRAAR